MLNRQVAAEARLIAEMYCGLKREAQIAMMANMEGMARTFPDLDRTVEISQPLPRNSGYKMLKNPPGMPETMSIKLGIKAPSPKGIPLAALAKYLESLQKTIPADSRLSLASIHYG